MKCMSPLLITALAATLVGCANAPIPDGTPEGPTPDPLPKETHREMSKDQVRQGTQFAQTLNAFAFDFYAASDRNDGKNRLVSPFSVSTNLSTLLLGAKGASGELLRTSLRLDPNLENMKEGASVLTAQMAASGEFRSANSLWSIGEYKVEPTYLADARRVFSAEFQTLLGTSDENVRAINAWVNKQTKERIPTILEKLEPDDRLVLVNALTFDGKWAEPFSKDGTSPGDFTLASGGTVNVPFLNHKRDVQMSTTGNGEGFQAIRLPYAGDEFSMTILLPGPSKPALTAKTWEELNRNFRVESGVIVSIPKFTMRDGYDLKAGLSKLGMGPLFESIDLTGISPMMRPEDTRIGAVFHKTFVEVTEEGTKAAASTATVVTVESISIPTTFRADRPFTFVIRHEKTGAILFIGHVADPS